MEVIICSDEQAVGRIAADRIAKVLGRAKAPVLEAASEMTPEEREEMIRGMVEKLADRLKENPNDIEGWKRLAKVYMVLGEKDKALEARNKVKELSGG